ncbi:MAG: YafY family protein [Anaerolineae bacterium]
MNRVDRLFGILLLLQANHQIRAEDIARHYEISQRTVYRDMAALSELGVPLVALPGEGYTLMEGFYLPPLIFTPEEASALALGAEMLAAQAAGHIASATETALTKLRAALPAETCHAIDSLIQGIGFGWQTQQFDLDDPVLITLQTAIHHQQVVTFAYQGYHSDAITLREVEPHKLNFIEKVWYLEGFCRHKQAPRTFRISRMTQVQRLPQRFSSPHPAQSDMAPLLHVVVRFSPETARKVRERQHFAFQKEEEAPDAHTLMHYAVKSTHEMIPWLLQWGAGAEALQPERLRQELRTELNMMLKMLT